MRIRTIKPEFWDSDDVTALPLEDRLLFVGLWSYVDDDGVGRDEDHLIIAALFARDMYEHPRRTVARVSRGLAHLAEAGLIVRYEVGGRAYLAVTGWARHQKVDRPKASRYPSPDQADARAATQNVPQDKAVREGSRQSREDVARARETPASGTGEPGNRGTGEQGSSSPSTRRDAGPDAEAPGDDEADDGPTGAQATSAEHADAVGAPGDYAGIPDGSTDVAPTEGPPGTDLAAPAPQRPDVERVCEHMAASVQARTGRRPRVTRRWRDAARLMLDRDGRTVADCMAAIDWAEDDDFWRANILSLPKLRQHYDRLSLQAQSRRRGREPAPCPLDTSTMTDADWEALGEQLWTSQEYRDIMKETETSCQAT